MNPMELPEIKETLPGQTPERVRLVIDYLPATDQVEVRGPINLRGLCYQMLKMAEKNVDEFYAKQVQGNGGAGIITRRFRG